MEDVTKQFEAETGPAVPADVQVVGYDGLPKIMFIPCTTGIYLAGWAFMNFKKLDRED